MRPPWGSASNASTMGRIDRSTTLSASMTSTGSPSQNRSANPRASAIPPARSW